YFWAIARESYIGFAYNTKLLPKGAVPKNYDGLLHPALKGRMGVSVSDPAYKVIGAMLRTKGKEFVQKLKVQEIALHTIIPPALLDLIASGEVLASPAIFRNHTLNAIAKGAPVNWVPMDIVPTNVGGAAIAVQPPHPHAALLLADYLLGPEGQSVLEKFEYGSATKNLGFKRWRPDHGIVTEKYEKELEGWEKLLKQISRKGG
ncbi:MAG: substrate-binding domain-containing protein, partial [Betaproteobacteria bacterium]